MKILNYFFSLESLSSRLLLKVESHGYLFVKPLMNLPEFFVGDVGVDLGGCDGAVAEHFLDRADVGAVY